MKFLNYVVLFCEYLENESEDQVYSAGLFDSFENGLFDCKNSNTTVSFSSLRKYDIIYLLRNVLATSKKVLDKP